MGIVYDSVFDTSLTASELFMSDMLMGDVMTTASLPWSSSEGVTTMYDPIKDELVSYVETTGPYGTISPPIKVTTRASEEYLDSSLRLSSVAMTPSGPAIVTTSLPVTATRLSSTIKTPYRSVYGSSFIMSDIYVPNITIGASALRTPIHGDVCDTSAIRERVSKLYWKKMIEKWLYRKDDCKRLNKYLKVVDGKVKLIDSIDKPDDYVSNDQRTVDLKSTFIEEKVMTLADTYAILKQFVKGTNTSWCDLPKQSYFVKEALEKTIENKLKRMIEDKKK